MSSLPDLCAVREKKVFFALNIPWFRCTALEQREISDCHFHVYLGDKDIFSRISKDSCSYVNLFKILKSRTTQRDLEPYNFTRKYHVRGEESAFRRLHILARVFVTVRKKSPKK